MARRIIDYIHLHSKCKQLMTKNMAFTYSKPISKRQKRVGRCLSICRNGNIVHLGGQQIKALIRFLKETGVDK